MTRGNPLALPPPPLDFAVPSRRVEDRQGPAELGVPTVALSTGRLRLRIRERSGAFGTRNSDIKTMTLLTFFYGIGGNRRRASTDEDDDESDSRAVTRGRDGAQVFAETGLASRHQVEYALMYENDPHAGR